MFYPLLIGTSLACDLGLFAQIPAPVPAAGHHGVATGEQTWQGIPLVGGNFTRISDHTSAQWEVVLRDGASDDEWLPAQFGYEKAENIDANHLYLAFNLGFLGNLVSVKRQLVVQVQNVRKGDTVQSCWWMIDPDPWMTKVAAWKSDAEWQRAMYGRWEVTPQPQGGTLVSYQWWTEVGRVPNALLKYAISNTLPDLLDAFDDRVGQLAR